jgi:putative endonuclease
MSAGSRRPAAATGGAEPEEAAYSRSGAGSAAERAVAAWLEQRGFTIVATNLRVGRLELDVVARRDRLVAVVEVRTRGPGAWTSALGSIDAAKRRRVRRAGERLWQRRYRDDSSVDHLRFDAASVTFTGGQPRVEYVAAAF